MIESKIIKLLQTAVTTAVGSDIPVKYMGINFKKPSNDKYWEIVYIPNNVTNESWTGEKTYRGILRLILHWPQNNKGAYEPTQEAERVADLLPKGKTMFSTDGTVKVILTDNPNLTSFVEDEGCLLLPLTIPYQCYKI